MAWVANGLEVGVSIGAAGLEVDDVIHLGRWRYAACSQARLTEAFVSLDDAIKLPVPWPATTTTLSLAPPRPSCRQVSLSSRGVRKSYLRTAVHDQDEGVLKALFIQDGDHC